MASSLCVLKANTLGKISRLSRDIFISKQTFSYSEKEGNDQLHGHMFQLAKLIVYDLRLPLLGKTKWGVPLPGILAEVSNVT